MVIYFSGTGNSKYCAEMIASKLKDEVVDSFGFIRNGIAGEFVSEKPWVFVAPTYCWRLPHIFEDFVKSADFGGSRDAYFVMTCGSDIGNAQKYIKKLCDLKKLNFKGVAEVVMPENYIAMFSVPDKDESERIVRVASRPLQGVINQIAGDGVLTGPKVNFIGKLTSGPVNPLFYTFVVKAKPFYCKEQCIGCGKCVELCPMNNIKLVNGRPEWGKSCTHCMACICRCPAEAIEYGNKSKEKPRYQCVEYIEK